MSGERSHPFDLVFDTFRADRLPAIRDALGDNADVNTFVLAGPALELLRDLRPDEGLGDGVDSFVALVHAAYLFWRDGEKTTALDEAATRALCAADARAGRPDETGVRYVQLAAHIIWGQLDDEAPFEPLDGWFAIPRGEQLRMVACFGVHAHRPGMSVVVVEGPLPGSVARADGTRLFAPTMPGGNAASLHAVSAPEELLLLGWRALNIAGDR